MKTTTPFIQPKNQKTYPKKEKSYNKNITSVKFIIFL
jgi:hypothetical protein